MEKKFNEKEYKKEYAKKNYMRIPFDMKIPDAVKFKENLKKENVKIAEFFNICVDNYKEILKKYKKN